MNITDTLTYDYNIHWEVAAESVWGWYRYGVAYYGFE